MPPRTSWTASSSASSLIPHITAQPPRALEQNRRLHLPSADAHGRQALSLPTVLISRMRPSLFARVSLRCRTVHRRRAEPREHAQNFILLHTRVFSSEKCGEIIRAKAKYDCPPSGEGLLSASLQSGRLKAGPTILGRPPYSCLTKLLEEYHAMT